MDHVSFPISFFNIFYSRFLEVVPDKPKMLKPSAKSTIRITNFNSGLCKKFHVNMAAKTCDREL